MRRAGANFRMSKGGKIYLARTWDRPNRRARKMSIIQAEICGREVLKAKRERDN